MGPHTTPRVVPRLSLIRTTDKGELTMLTKAQLRLLKFLVLKKRVQQKRVTKYIFLIIKGCK